MADAASAGVPARPRNAAVPTWLVTGAGREALIAARLAHDAALSTVVILEGLPSGQAPLADLAEIASKHTRASMVPENTPDLMPTLTRLFGSAIKLVGTDMKRATAWVKDQLKKDPRFKTFWNKIAPATYNKAALAALDARPQDARASLFDDQAQADAFLLAGEILLHLDEEVGVGQPDPVASGRPEHVGIDGAGQSGGHVRCSWS